MFVYKKIFLIFRYSCNNFYTTEYCSTNEQTIVCYESEEYWMSPIPHNIDDISSYNTLGNLWSFKWRLLFDGIFNFFIY